VIATMPVEIWDARFFTPAQAQAIGELINQVWPKPNMTAELRAEQQIELGKQFLGERGPAPRAVVLLDGQRLVAHASIFPRVIGTDEGEMLIGGLARVCTDPAMRGHGLGEQVVREAFKLVDAGQFDAALFQTKQSVRPFYEKLGCTLVQNRIVNSLGDDPAANPFWDEVVMRYPSSASWPPGTIDLCGAGY
jgi:GNAT superfamily N-acetyltransferase